jgi:outer membrane protein assembly factor BamB
MERQKLSKSGGFSQSAGTVLKPSRMLLLVCLWFQLIAARADWPTPHADWEHRGRSEERLRFPLTLQWAVEFENERIGSAMEPLIISNRVWVGTHAGNLWGLDPLSGAPMEGRRFEQPIFRMPLDARLEIPALDAPVRQTPARSGDFVYVTAEDLRLRCFEARSGKLVWTSEQMSGQSAVDSYPVVATVAGKKFVIVRTNPVLGMAQQIANDRNFLTAQARIDASDWKKLDAWIKSPEAAGTREQIQSEQEAIVHYFGTNRWAETFFVFNAETGRRAFTAPVMWVGGCQGIGAPPAITKDGKAVVLYRSAYGNWNHGVAPLVALGLLNFETHRIEPLRHNQGAQPPWNTFWGTADEEQNFTIAGDDLIIVHQGTLSRFNLATHDLEKIWGERDTYGGFKNPAWARNEWHGPGRGGVAISDGRVYWITGSRLLCLGPEDPKNKPTVRTLKSSEFTLQRAEPSTNFLTTNSVKTLLEKSTSELLSTNWAPLYVEPGLSGREFFFAESGDLFTALSLGYPHVDKETQTKIKERLASEFKDRAPFSDASFYALTNGARRELFAIPDAILKRLDNDKPAHRFGGIYSVWLYAERCNAWPIVLDRWPEIEAQFHSFKKENPRFGEKPELYFNRYLASLIALADIADNAQQPKVSFEAQRMIQNISENLAQWWNEAGETLTTFNGSAQLDPFISKGDKFSFAVFPHRHKIALFKDLAPEIGDVVRSRAPEAAQKIWTVFGRLYATWPAQGEERQVHFGENFVDPPDLALGAFQELAFAQKKKAGDLFGKLDQPFCKADLNYIQKLALSLEAAP